VLVVGQTVPVSLTIRNANTGSEVGLSDTLTQITLVPSCGQPSGGDCAALFFPSRRVRARSGPEPDGPLHGRLHDGRIAAAGDRRRRIRRRTPDVPGRLRRGLQRKPDRRRHRHGRDDDQRDARDDDAGGADGDRARRIVHRYRDARDPGRPGRSDRHGDVRRLRARQRGVCRHAGAVVDDRAQRERHRCDLGRPDADRGGDLSRHCRHRRRPRRGRARRSSARASPRRRASGPPLC
jgi:hypothetical protein